MPLTTYLAGTCTRWPVTGETARLIESPLPKDVPLASDNTLRPTSMLMSFLVSSPSWVPGKVRGSLLYPSAQLSEAARTSGFIL